MLPKAEVPSFIPHRLRLRIPSKRGDLSFLKGLEAHWLKAFPDTKVSCSIASASLLITGAIPDADAVTEFGRRLALFEWEPGKARNRAWTGGVQAAMLSLNRRIQEASQGSLDLVSAIFVALLIMGITELIRGRWKTPPWYTAFWYAFGVYSKAWLDQSTKPTL